MSGNGGNQFDPSLLTKEINASNAAERAAELTSARAALERQLADVTEANRDRKSTRLNSSHSGESRMPSSA